MAALLCLTGAVDIIRTVGAARCPSQRIAPFLTSQKLTSAQVLVKQKILETHALDFDWPGVTKEQADWHRRAGSNELASELELRLVDMAAHHRCRLTDDRRERGLDRTCTKRPASGHVWHQEAPPEQRRKQAEWAVHILATPGQYPYY